MKMLEQVVARRDGEEIARLRTTNGSLRSVLQRIADRFDAGVSGRCAICGAGRKNGGWIPAGPLLANEMVPPHPCPNASCLSHELREVLTGGGE